MKEEIAKIFIKWGMPTRQIVILEIVNFINKLTGGCENCYGKGYSTTINGYSDEATGAKWTEPAMLICRCERGKTLKETLEKIIDLKMQKIKNEVVSNSCNTYANMKLSELKRSL